MIEDSTSDPMAASHACVPKVPDISRSSVLSLLSSSPTSVPYDRHTFSKIDLRSTTTVTRSTLAKRKREASKSDF